MTATIAFVMDPLEGIEPQVDTSFGLMLAAQARGARVFHVPPAGISLGNNAVVFHGSSVELNDTKGNSAHFRVIERTTIAAADCAGVFIRTDPPFDEDYLTATWLLSFAERQGTRIINSPAGIRAANEKLYALEFPQFCPRTIVSANRAEILTFIETCGGEAIAKPIDGFAGFGILRLHADDSNCSAIIDLLSLEGKRPILVQEYLAAGADGDKRLFFVDGHLRGAVSRVAPSNDHRGNVHVGGSVVKAELDGYDRFIEAALGDRLRADGLYFVGVDVIDSKLIEVNVTSPTLIRQLTSLSGLDLAEEIVGSLF